MLAYLQATRRTPTILVFLSALFIWWLHFRYSPFYQTWVNILVSGMWLGISYTGSLLMVTAWAHRNGNPDFHDWMTWVSFV